MSAPTTHTPELAARLAPWLEEIDADLAARDVELSHRPFDALFALLRSGAIELRAGDDPIDVSSPINHAAEGWFRSLYVAVETWYKATFGEAALRHKGAPALDGIVLLRDAPLVLAVPNHRNKVEEPGKLAWMYFEDGVAEGEEAIRWVRGAPDLAATDPERHAVLAQEAHEVASALRFIHFRKLGVASGDEAARGLAHAVSLYIQLAARQIASGRPEERGPAWCDLQMAMESALKLVLQRATGTYPHSHVLETLLEQAVAQGMAFDAVRLTAWPSFAEISDNRYVQGAPGTVTNLYSAYRLALDLIAAAMATVTPAINAGAGFLLSFPPWLSDDQAGAFGPVETAAAEPRVREETT